MSQIIILTGTASYISTRPIGAYQIANTLRLSGYSVQVVDFYPLIVYFGGLDLLKKVLAKFIGPETLWIGFSTTFLFPNQLSENKSNYALKQEEENSLLLLDNNQQKDLKNYVSKLNPNIKWVAGGARSWMHNKSNFLIDCFIEGYADVSAVEYTKFLEGKNPFFQYRKNFNGTISVIYDRKGDLFNFIDHKFSWHPSDYIFENEPLPIEISRGCIFKCKFCSYPLNGKKKFDYIKNPNLLYDEFMFNYENFNTTNYIFLDDTYNDSPYKVELLYNKVFSKLPFKINWGSYIRLDLLAAHPETIDILKESGIKSAFFGIESLNYESNKSVGKGLKSQKIEETLRTVKLKWSETLLQAGFIIGLPYDSEETIREWFKIISQPEYPLDVISIFVLQIFPKLKKDLNAVWFNEIEKDPNQYGYSFLDDKNIVWQNNCGLTKIRASELHKEFTSILETNNKINCGWGTTFGLLNFGYPDLQSAKENFKSLSDDFLKNKAFDNLNLYLSKLLS